KILTHCLRILLLDLRIELQVLAPPASKIRRAEIDRQGIAGGNDGDFAGITDVNLGERGLAEFIKNLSIHFHFAQIAVVVLGAQSIENRKARTAHWIRIENCRIQVELVNLAANPGKADRFALND